MNKRVLITGATSGIGFEASRQIAQMGSKVIGIGSSKASCDRARAKMLSYGFDVEYLACDLSDQTMIKKLSANIKSKYDKLDVLINNAGVIYLKRKIDSNGVEKMFSVNYLSHYLLTRLLLDTLSIAPKARIINVSSIAHRQVRIDFDDLNSEKYKVMDVYGKTKLAQLLFTQYLATKLDSSGITVNAMHPGLIHTNLVSKNGVLGSILTAGWKLFGKSPKEGAKTVVYLANSKEVENISGRYFVKCNPVKLGSHAVDTTVAQILWDKSAEMCSLPKNLEF
jgi:NAD(P)-dependent dehydrogenase (short-subunit alcohol dehydrogenase family)